MEPTILIVTAVTVGLLGLIKGERSRRRRRRVAEFKALTSWAENNGWRIYEGIDLHYANVADRVTGLTGDPNDWEFTVGMSSSGSPDVYVPAPQWEYGTILARDTTDGEMIVFSCWREGQSEHHVFCALRSGGVFAPYTVDYLRPDKFYVDGVTPAIEDFQAERVFSGLMWPARLRLLDGMLLLRAPGRLSPELAVAIAERIAQINDGLPRRPDLGPMR